MIDIPNDAGDEMHIGLEVGCHAELRSKENGATGKTNWEAGNYDLDTVDMYYRVRGVDVALDNAKSDEPLIDELLRAIEKL